LAIDVPRFGHGRNAARAGEEYSLLRDEAPLIVDFTAANHELMELQNQQTQAVIDQDPDFRAPR